MREPGKNATGAAEDKTRGQDRARGADFEAGPRLVVGLGASGLSVARYLLRAGVCCAVTDSRAAPPKAAELAALADTPRCFGGFASPLALDAIVEAVVSPGVSLDEPFIGELVDAGIPIIGDIDLFARAIRSRRPNPGSGSFGPESGPESGPRVIAVTGSNGKSTVTAWLAEIAAAAGISAAAGANFGTPALDLIAPGVDLYILELSSFQLELSAELATRAAAVLNVSADHIDRHGGLERYAAQKARIYRRAEIAVVNADDARVAAMDTHAARVVRFGRAADADYRVLETADGGLLLARGSRPWLAADALALTGRHNVYNALAAWALAEAAGFDEAPIAAGLRAFTGLAHRCQTVAAIGGVTWVDDSKATNPGAAMASLAGMRAPVILLAGGQAKGADFDGLGALAGALARAVIVFGADADAIAAAVATRVAVHRVADLRAAVARAAALARPGDTVLLSPGCASHDQFADYAERGDTFVSAVRALAA